MSVNGPVVFRNNDISPIEDAIGRLALINKHETCHSSAYFTNPTNFKDIDLFLSVKNSEDKGSGAKRSIQAFSHETIHELKIQVRNKEYSSIKHGLIFGDRQLMQDEDFHPATTNGGDYLHILTRLSDVKRMEVLTDKQKKILNKTDQGTSAVDNGGSTKSLSPAKQAIRKAENRLVLRKSLLEEGKELCTPRMATPDSDPVIHLVIRKSIRVHCHHLKGDGFELRISSGATVDDVKCKIEEVTEGFQAHEHDVVKDGRTLQHGMSLSELGVNTGDILEVVEVPLCLEEYPESENASIGSPKAVMSDEWKKAKDALAHGVRPKLTSAGTGGSYFISALEGNNLAVFKPQDEEPLAPNNPKGHKGSLTGDGLRRGVRPGEGATREVIAYILDHEHFSGVPPTAMVSLSQVHPSSVHRKVGSFQQFVQHDMDCEEMGPSKFPVQEVHKICVLDIRLANADRNGGNILARQDQGQWKLTPIDHGYCLPDSFEDINFEWMYWPQAKQPFDQATADYIRQLDAQHDLNILAKNGLSLRPGCARMFLLCTMLLKKALTHGLTPYQIGLIMCRQTLRMSPLEKLHKQARRLTLRKMYGDSNLLQGTTDHLEIDERIYLETMSSLMDQYFDETHNVQI